MLSDKMFHPEIIGGGPISPENCPDHGREYCMCFMRYVGIAKRKAKRETQDKRRERLKAFLEKRGFQDRTEYTHSGSTATVDGKYIFYAQKWRARAKGSNEYFTPAQLCNKFLKKR
jgi:hypothetical protein